MRVLQSYNSYKLETILDKGEEIIKWVFEKWEKFIYSYTKIQDL